MAKHVTCGVSSSVNEQGTVGNGECVPFQVEMLVCEETWQAVSGGEVAWLKEDPDPQRREWRTCDFDNTLFPGGAIPFKYILKGDNSAPMHDLAAKYYAMAHRAGRVSGIPVGLQLSRSRRRLSTSL